jgi:predicted transposase YdaD
LRNCGVDPRPQEGIVMASEVLIRISRDEAERARLMSEYKYVVDTQSKVVQAKREGRKEGLQEGRKEGLQEGKKEGLQEGRKEGLQEGRKEGLQEGRKEGLQEGRKEGLQEGEQKKAVEFALKLRKRGVAVEQIAEDTGLTLKQIEELRG